jgi:uncharacterized coiled-coil DUF342 family protein
VEKNKNLRDIQIPQELKVKRNELDEKLENIKEKLNKINSAIDLFIGIVQNQELWVNTPSKN